jgi:chromosome segregation ATPase
VEEKASLELKFQDYAQTLSRYEEAVTLKEGEKAELVQSYNVLNSETERLTATIQDMQESLSKARNDSLALARVCGGGRKMGGRGSNPSRGISI